MTEDYSSIDADAHARSQTDGMSRDDLLALVATLTIQLQAARGEIKRLRARLNEAQLCDETVYHYEEEL